MYIQDPISFLKKLCPICKQGSCLVLIKCSKCNTILVQCDEELSVFKDFKEISDKNIYTSTQCPNCSSVNIDDFVTLNIEEIKKLGLKKDIDY